MDGLKGFEGREVSIEHKYESAGEAAAIQLRVPLNRKVGWNWFCVKLDKWAERQSFAWKSTTGEK